MKKDSLLHVLHLHCVLDPLLAQQLREGLPVPGRHHDVGAAPGPGPLPEVVRKVANGVGLILGQGGGAEHLEAMYERIFKGLENCLFNYVASIVLPLVALSLLRSRHD